MAGVDRMTIRAGRPDGAGGDHADVVRESVRWVAQQLMESEVSVMVGAELGERRPDDRAAHRNGSTTACVRPMGRTCASSARRMGSKLGSRVDETSCKPRLFRRVRTSRGRQPARSVPAGLR